MPTPPASAGAAPAAHVERLPVVVVGAGPTGVTAALALAVQGVDVVLLERHAEVYALPRAVHLDDEVVRLLQGLGVGPAFAAISRPALGLRLLDPQHRTLAEFRRNPLPTRHGHPQANMFDQPALEQLLRDRLATHPGIVLRTGVEVLDVEVPDEPGRGPVVVLRDGSPGRVERLAASAVLGCDGADSLVRTVVGARWRDLRFTQRWLVLDVRSPVPLGTWEGIHQVCDGRRAATFMQVGADRYRWEFQLRDGERAEALQEPAALAPLVRPWTGDVPFERLEVLRSTGYVFRARLADRWRRGRVLLLGDAAHQTPPFVGQGLGTGLRDAGNLAWKLAAVLDGRAPEALLDSYQAERLPHARSMIRLAVTAGWAMTGGGGRAVVVRRALLGGLCRVPGAAERVLDRGTPALARGPLVPRSRRAGARRTDGRRAPQRLSGTLVPQPRVQVDLSPPVLLDDVLGPGFAVLTTADVDVALVRLAQRLRAPVLRVGATSGPGTVRVDGTLAAWLLSGGAKTAVLRPDRVVLVTSSSRRAPGEQLVREQGAVLRAVGA